MKNKFIQGYKRPLISESFKLDEATGSDDKARKSKIVAIDDKLFKVQKDMNEFIEIMKLDDRNKEVVALVKKSQKTVSDMAAKFRKFEK